MVLTSPYSWLEEFTSKVSENVEFVMCVATIASMVIVFAVYNGCIYSLHFDDNTSRC